MKFLNMLGLSHEVSVSGHIRLLSFKALWILVGRMPDGDLIFRFASPLAGGIQRWAKAQMNAGMSSWVASCPTACLIARNAQLEELILLGYNAAEVGNWTYESARCQEAELDKQIRSIQGELQSRDALALQQA